MYAALMAAGGRRRASGGGTPNTDYLQLQTYTGNGSFPRSFASTEDISDGFIWTKRRTVANQSARRFFKDGGSWYGVNGAASARFSAPDFSADTDSWDLAADTTTFSTNVSGSDYMAWLFKKQAGAVDWVLFNGNGSNQSPSHSLGVPPGAMLVRNLTNGTGTNGAWQLYHRGFNGGTNPEQYGKAWENSSLTTSAQYWNNTVPGSSSFTLGNGAMVNENSARILAMLFAHDTSPSGVVQCGYYTGNGSASGPTESLGWDPRMVWIFRLESGTDPFGFDTARTAGFTGSDAAASLVGTAQDDTSTNILTLTGSGFQIVTTGTPYNTTGGKYGYIAFR